MNDFLIFTNQDIRFHLELIFKIFLSIIISGLVGLERESIHRPAGYRTHVLVGVGSTLVMITSEYIFNHYHTMTNSDPARLGAQVISGMGFLGAGTIIKEGSSVKGLTTAAGLWAVSCIGLAIGIGFYSGAVIAAIAILMVLKKMMPRPKKKSKVKDEKEFNLEVEMDKEDSSIGDIEKIVRNEGAFIKEIKYIQDLGASLIVRVNLDVESSEQYQDIIEAIDETMGIVKVTEV